MDEFVNHSSIRWNGYVGEVQYGANDASKMIVMFYMKPVPNPAKSTEAGRPVFDDKIYVRIHPPGERLNIIDRAVTDIDKKRWPIQWMQFMENAPQVSTGTPVEMLYPANPSTPAALKASGVHTVEQLSELSAHAIETIGMGCQQWVNDATRYLQVANKGVKGSELKKELDDRDREINHLKNKIDLLVAELSNFREHASQSVTMKDVQKMIANQGGGGKRAVYPKGSILDGTFDAQTAQINATHLTTDLTKPRKRQRPKIG